MGENTRFELAKMRTFAGTSFFEFHIYGNFAEYANVSSRESLSRAFTARNDNSTSTFG